MSLWYGWYRDGQVTLRICEGLQICVCVRVHTSLKVVCEKASPEVLNLQGAQTFHGQPKVFICHKCTIYVPVSSTIMKTVWIGCRRTRVIQRGEKDWSIAGKENQGVKCSLSRGDNLHHSRSLYLSNLDKITCRKAFFFCSFLKLFCYLPLSTDDIKIIFHKDKPPSGWYFLFNSIHN